MSLVMKNRKAAAAKATAASKVRQDLEVEIIRERLATRLREDFTQNSSSKCGTDRSASKKIMDVETIRSRLSKKLKKDAEYSVDSMWGVTCFVGRP